MRQQRRLQQQMQELILADPWYGLTLRHFKLRVDNNCPTIGIRAAQPPSTCLELVFNEQFVADLSRHELCEVLKHEVLHPTFHHLRKETSGVRWNIAQDAAINSHLSQPIMHELCRRIGAVLPGQGLLEGVPLGKSSDWYFANLPAGVENAVTTLDAHYALDPQTAERLRDVIQQSTDAVVNMNQWGSVSASLREHLTNYLSGYDWRAVLASVIAKTRDSDVVTTRRKMNKRLPHSAGVYRKRVPRVLVALDESGSVDASLWSLLANALASLSMHASFTLLPFEAVVHDDRMQAFEKGKQAIFSRQCTGGTDFNAPTEWFNAHKKDYDLLIMATDGQASPPSACAKRRVWVLPATQTLAFPTTERVVLVR